MGLIIAILIMGLWGGHLAWILATVDASWSNPWMYLHVAVQAYLYTGLFITGHDAMHRNVSSRAWVNRLVGTLSAWLFACLSYRRLEKNHFLHHRFPGTEKDPDYSMRSQNMFYWWGLFLFRYSTIWQIVGMATIFNVLHLLLNVPVSSLVAFWVIPAFLGSLQLFYFGTFRPHQPPHLARMGVHRARSMTRNHVLAMLSCYFFGYHREHHESPGVPWWQLYREKR
jgi:beta-carotene ketolase (CrtW type)